MSLPLLADFAIRLGGGLAILLPTIPWRVVPPRFFRTHCQVILGLGVLATLVVARTGFGAVPFGLTLAMAVLAFASSIAWGLGLPRVGIPMALGIAALTAAILATSSEGGGAGLRALNAASALSSAFLLGATLTAMLLGHYYLTAPAMSIAPLARSVKLMGGGLAVRAVLAGLAIGFASGVSPFFLAIRWGMGIAGVGLATFLTWRTVEIRSTQSATGILYIAMTLLLFGELSSLILARESGLTI